VTHFGVDHLNPWWTKYFVEIPTLIKRAYPMSE
jgi:hypothetical protein